MKTESAKKATCIHSCVGLCQALTFAEHNERDAIDQYKQYLDVCDYPDVRELLRGLIDEHSRLLQTLEEKRSVLESKFRTLDEIRESFL
jgi:rubrerythrin